MSITDIVVVAVLENGKIHQVVLDLAQRSAITAALHSVCPGGIKLIEEAMALEIEDNNKTTKSIKTKKNGSKRKSE